MNRAAERESSPSSKKRAADLHLENEGAPSTCKKRNVTVEMMKKWILENDKEIATSGWCTDRERVSALNCKCSVCIQFEDKLHSLRNYHPAFITGSTNLRASSCCNRDAHACDDLILYKKSKSTTVTDY